MDPLEKEAKELSDKWEKEGFKYAGLFGLDFQETFRALRKHLKPHGLTIERRGSYKEYADSSWIRIVKIKKPRTCPKCNKKHPDESRVTPWGCDMVYGRRGWRQLGSYDS